MRASAALLLVLVSTLCADTEWKALPPAETLQAIRSAQDVYIFPYTFSGFSEHPTVDQKHLRPLDPTARDALKRLLGDERNWYKGLLTVVEPLGVRSAGVLFRTETHELVLFFTPTTIWGSFRGQSYSGALEHKPIEELDQWEERYARPELQDK